MMSRGLPMLNRVCRIPDSLLGVVNISFEKDKIK